MCCCYLLTHTNVLDMLWTDIFCERYNILNLWFSSHHSKILIIFATNGLHQTWRFVPCMSTDLLRTLDTQGYILGSSAYEPTKPILVLWKNYTESARLHHNYPLNCYNDLQGFVTSISCLHSIPETYLQQQQGICSMGVIHWPLNTELNPICHLLALLGALPIFHVTRIRVKPLHLGKSY
jgi:hypothetical protein